MTPLARHLAAAVLAACALATLSCRSGSGPAAPAGAAAQAVPALMPVETMLVDRPGLLVARLANGMDVLLAERRAAPVCTVQVWVRAGSITEDELPGSGISHFVEHMLFKGTAKRGVRQMDREFAAAGGHDNAYTSGERTVYHITLPAKNFAVALDGLADAVQNAAFAPEEVEREREVIVKEINLGEDDPGRILYRYISQTEYQVAPERHPVIGYRPVFEKITRAQLVGYWRRMYSPGNLVFVAAGDFDAKAALKQVQAAFAGFERRAFVPPIVPDEPPQASPRELRVRDAHFRDARLYLSWPTVGIAHEDMYPLDMGAMLLGGGRTSRLHRRLVEQEKLVYSIGAGNHTPARAGHFSIHAKLDEKNVEKVLAIIDEEVKKLAAGPIDPADMQRVLARHRAQEVFERETVDGLAGSLGGDYLTTGDVDFSTKYLARLDKVQAGDVADALERYLVPERRNLVLVLPAKAAREARKPEPAGPAAAPAPKIERVELPGGGRLLLYERHDDPIVTVNAVFLAGLRFEPEGQNGVSDLMASMLTRGTEQHSSEQLAEVLEASGGSLSGFGGRNSFGVSAKFLSRDLTLALGLVNEVLSKPTFAEDEFQKLRARVLAGIRRRVEDIDEVHELLVEKMLYAPHPYSRTAAGTEASVKGLTRKDLVDFHARFCRPDNMVLCVAGDFKTEELKKQIPEVFAGFLKPRADKFSPPAVAKVPGLAGEKREGQDMAGAKQALLTLAFRGVDLRDPDRFALEVMRSVLSGMGGRLFEELRDKQSLAYSVGMYLETGVDPGAVVFYIATEADKVDRALAGIRVQIDRVRNEPVPAADLERAKNQIVGGDASRRQRLSGVSQDMAYNELYGLGAEASLQRIKEIEKVTAEDVRRVARKYLLNESCVVAITKPTKEEKTATPPPQPVEEQ
jgi:zinc protease